MMMSTKYSPRVGDDFDDEPEEYPRWVGDGNDEERSECTHVRWPDDNDKDSKYSRWVGDDNDEEHKIDDNDDEEHEVFILGG
jgi:hypothetical protein